MPDVESLLERTDPLDIDESIEACVLALKKDKNQLVRQWLGEPGKLACTEQMGDAIKPYDSELALAVYIRAQAADKVIRCYAESGQFEKILHHSQTLGYQEEDYIYLLESVAKEETSEQAVDLAIKLCSFTQQDGSKAVSGEAIVKVFLDAHLEKACLKFLYEVAKDGLRNDGALQTRLFELQFSQDPEIAKNLLLKNTYTNYNRKKVAQLCEDHGYFMLALERYQSAVDFKRVFSNEKFVQVVTNERENVLQFLSMLGVDETVQCLEGLISISGDLKSVAAELVCELYRDQFEQQELVDQLKVIDIDGEIVKQCEIMKWQREKFRYCLSRKNTQLWLKYLKSGIVNDKYFKEEIIVAACQRGEHEKIKELAEAMTEANMTDELIKVLENLLIDKHFDDKYLKSLLLKMAIEHRKAQVKKYAMKLDGYDGEEIAKLAEQSELFEESFAIFDKFGDKKSAMRILIERINDSQRTRNYAGNDPSLMSLIPFQWMHDDAPDDVSEVVEIEKPAVVPELSIASPPIIDDVLVPGLEPTPRIEIKPPKKKLPPIRHPVKKPPAKQETKSEIISEPSLMTSKTSATSRNSAMSTTTTANLAEFATQHDIKKNALKVLKMTPEDVQQWLGDIGLGEFADKFDRYNGQMLDNLYSLRYSVCSLIYFTYHYSIPFFRFLSRPPNSFASLLTTNSTMTLTM